MALDPENIERLKELGRKLPKKLEVPIKSSTKNAPFEKKKHKIETEQDPDLLFHSLMEASPDGSVPSHLLNRLKQLESKQNELSNNLEVIDSKQSQKSNLSQQSLSPSKQEDSLYLTFKNLLIEEDS